MKDCLAQIHNMLINEDHMGQVKFVCLFKVTVLNLHEIMMKPKIKLTQFQQLESIEAIPVELLRLLLLWNPIA